MKLRIFLSALVFLACSTLVQAASKPAVVATTSMLADTVRAVGGDRIDVHALMGPGAAPHLNNAPANAVAKLQRAKLIISTGLMLEGQMGELLGPLAKGRRVLAVGETLPADRLLGGDGNHPDPHIWGDA